MPPVSANLNSDLEDRGPIPRRTKFTPAPRAWWRPRSTFGRVLLGMAAVTALGGLTALGILTRNFLTRDPHFRIPGAANVQSTGLSEVKRAEVLPVFGEDIGRNIFFVPLSTRRKQLEAIPWVQQATVMRFLPDRLSVSVVERTPVAFVRQGDQVELADADGVILSMPPAMMAQHHYSFPVVTGIDGKDSLASRRARMAVYQRFLAELDQNHKHLTDQVSEIDVSDPEDLRATMPEQGSDILAHFGDDHFLDRLQIYKSHIAEWRQRYPKLIGVDLRYSGDVPLEMATDGGGAASTEITALVPAAAPKVVVKPSASVAGLATQPSATAPPKPAPATANAHAAAVRAAQLKAARLKFAKQKAAREKAARLKAQNHHPTSAATRQAQPTT